MAKSGLESLGGVLTSAPAVCSWGPSRLDVFARGADGGLMHNWFDGSWNDWERLGSEVIAGDPCAVSWGPGRIDVLVRGTDGGLYHKSFDGEWSGYRQLSLVPFEGSPAVCSWGPGRLDVFVRGADGGLRHMRFDGSWHPFEPLGGTLTSDPAAVAWGPGRIDVLARTPAGSLGHIWHENNVWSAWEDLGGELETRPAICSAGVGSLDIFCVGSQGRVHARSYQNQWGAWAGMEIQVASSVACACWEPTRVDLFARGSRGQLVHAWRWAGGPWEPAPGPVAICLSGGGSRGDFQVGALEYLYQQGIRPDILCGTSVGAINATKLAEGEDPGKPDQGLTGLGRIWSGLRYNDDMWREEPWLTDPNMDQRIADVIRGRPWPEDPAPRNNLTLGVFDDISYAVRLVGYFGRRVVDAVALALAYEVMVSKARALANLDPIKEKMATAFDPEALGRWAAAGGRLRLTMVGLDSGRLRYVTESGAVLERDGTPVLVPDAMPAACAASAEALSQLEATIEGLRDHLRELQAQLSRRDSDKGRLGRDIRATNAKLDEELAKLPALRGALAACLTANRSWKELRVPDLRPVVLASASIPGYFPPQPIGDDDYVDGGVREVMPLQSAVDLGAGQIFAIHASSRSLPPFRTPRTAGMVQIVSRGLTEIAIDEVAHSDRTITGPGRPAPVIVHIEPEENLHDIRVIDPGLIQIARDYGFMAAADAVGSAAGRAERRQLATNIAKLRLSIWKLENRRFGQNDPTEGPAAQASSPEPALQPEIDEAKRRLTALILRRRQRFGPVPAGIDNWGSQPELHPWLTALSARFVGQTVPTYIRIGESKTASITFANDGALTWDPALGHRLGAQSPPDNDRWGKRWIELPHPVKPGESITLSILVSSPGTGEAVFQWQMQRADVAWFGPLSPAVRIRGGITSDDPRCGKIRERLQSIAVAIAELEDRLTGDLREDAPIRGEISRARSKQTALLAEATQLSCVL